MGASTQASPSAACYGDLQLDLVGALNGIAEGSPQALDVLYEATSAKLFGVCLRIVNDRSEAEDILQDVYLTVWRHASTFDRAKGSPIAWMVAIARNRSIDRLRTTLATSGCGQSGDGAEIVDPAPMPDVEIEHSEQRQQIFNAIGGLESRHADAILHIYRGGLTYDQAALRMNVPVGTVKSWVRRGLLKLRKSLDQ